MKGNFINIIIKKIKKNKNICFIISLFVFIFSNYSWSNNLIQEIVESNTYNFIKFGEFYIVF